MACGQLNRTDERTKRFRYDAYETMSPVPGFPSQSNPSVEISCVSPPIIVQSLSPVQLFATLWTAARQASLSSTISQSFLKVMSTESLMLSTYAFLCHLLILLPSIFPSIRVFPNESALCIRWSKYWGFRFSISASKEYSGWIFFRIDRFDLFAVQGNLKSLL